MLTQHFILETSQEISEMTILDEYAMNSNEFIYYDESMQPVFSWQKVPKVLILHDVQRNYVAIYNSPIIEVIDTRYSMNM